MLMHRVAGGARIFGRVVAGTLAAILLLLVAGIPWGLWHYVGWPLPDHVPTWDEVEVVLLTPMSTALLLDTLACILWPLWGAFTLDVLRTASDALQHFSPPRVRTASPLHACAAALVGAVALALLGQRPPIPATEVWRSPVATALQDPTPQSAVLTGTPIGHRQPPPNSVEVRPPHNGIYDSLWRIADRELGDGCRWPQIYALNKGHPQPDGGSLSNPNLIQPGWQLRLPAAKDRQPSPPPRDTPPRTPPSPTPSAPSEPPPSTPESAKPTRPPRSPPAPGIDLPTGAYVGIGLAAAITAAAMTVRLRRHTKQSRDSERRDDHAIAPIVRAIRSAHQQQVTADPEAAPAERALTDEEVLHERDYATEVAEKNAGAFGVRDGTHVALDLASTHGLGLTGPGALAAARALLIGLLAQPQSSEEGSTKLVVPAADATQLLGQLDDHLQDAGLHVTHGIDDALDTMEAELLTRTRLAAASQDDDARRKRLVLVATPAEHAERRLQAILDNGAAVGLAGILLGPWPPGGTVRIRPDGSVAAASPGLQGLLAGSRLFNLPAPDASALVSLLAEAAPQGAGAAEPEEDAYRISVAEPAAHAVTTAPTHPRAQLRVLGRFQLAFDDTDIGSAIAARKQREILVYLTLHRGGARREALADALWPDLPATRPYNRLHATLSQLRRALRAATNGAVTDPVARTDQYYALDDEQFTVDLWDLDAAIRAHREHPDSEECAAGLERALELYAGDMAEELDAEWLVGPREEVRRRVLSALGDRIRATRPTTPQHALELLERARELDRYNEDLYCEIAAIQARIGPRSAVATTLNLLTAALAELDLEPSEEALQRFQQLRHPEAEGDATPEELG